MANIYVSWPGYSAEDPETGGRLIAAGHQLSLRPKLGARAPEDVARLIAGCAAAIVSTDPFPSDVIASNPALRVIARVGVGTDSIDLHAATAAGIAVCITPGLNAETTADHAVALILALLRKVTVQDEGVKRGHWDRFGPNMPSELYGKTVGIVGAGTIGRAVMRRLSGFSVNLVYFDGAAFDLPEATKLRTLRELLGVSDIVSLHAPLTAQSRGMINSSAIAFMKPGAFIVNTARGPLMDEDAVFAALQERRLAGAALDVFQEEPPRAELLASIPNLITSAHVGGLSVESVRRMTASATTSVLDVLSGTLPSSAVNRSTLHRSF